MKKPNNQKAEQEKRKLENQKFMLERRKLVDHQPTIIEITEVLKKVLSGELTQDEASDWAVNYIVNDDLFEVTDERAWDYLYYVMCLGKIGPDEYLYFDDDINAWIEEFSLDPKE